MPFKHYIQKLEGRLPEYPASRSKRTWVVKEFSVTNLYFRDTEEILDKFITTGNVTNGEWFRVFSWVVAENTFKYNTRKPTDITRWYLMEFSELDEDQQDFLLAVRDRALVQG